MAREIGWWLDRLSHPDGPRARVIAELLLSSGLSGRGGGTIVRRLALRPGTALRIENGSLADALAGQSAVA